MITTKNLHRQVLKIIQSPETTMPLKKELFTFMKNNAISISTFAENFSNKGKNHELVKEYELFLNK